MLIKHTTEEVQDKYNPEGATKIKRRHVKKIHIDNKKLKKMNN
jgi:hypothetical protein